ncbi:hypothetical protein WN51_10356 [Melipona quadrifasciata]|uniref:Uncharacterized protein n=1 Tax=Melipona quadrifasciata TaxID=166423 RepID=A0A0N0BJ61_9HYME|nr:hypothetical protein WN51_10356 [Melipona quadrifasciata]
MTVSARFCFSPRNFLSLRKRNENLRHQFGERGGTNAHYASSEYLGLKYIGKRADYVSRVNGVCGAGRIVES